MFGYCTISDAPISALCRRSTRPIVRTPDSRLCEVPAELRELLVDLDSRELLVADCVPRLLFVEGDLREILVREAPRVVDVPRAPREEQPKRGGVIVVERESRALTVTPERRVVYIPEETSREVSVGAESRTCSVDEERA